MDYQEAHAKALEVLKQLAPHCDRIEIAGSIRRKKQTDIKDIEIVAIPKPYDIDLFESGIATVINQWQCVKGKLKYYECKYTQRLLPDETKVDIFFAVPENWGYILAIRTGSADYSHNVLATGWVKRGYKGVDGMLTKDGRRVDILEEKDLFELLHIPYCAPELRQY